MVAVNRIRTVMTGVAGTPWYVNMHFAQINGVTPQDQVQAVVDFWTAIKGRIDSRVLITVEGAVAQIDVPTGETTSTVQVQDGQVQPTGGANAIARSLQVLVRLRTPLYTGGRALQGRLFLPGFTKDAETNDGKFNTNLSAGIVTAVQALQTAGLSVYGKSKGVVASVTGVTVWDDFAVLRSRRD